MQVESRPQIEPHAASLEFDTERLRVRRLSNDDEVLFCGLYTDADTMRFIGDPFSLERATRSFRKTVASWQDDPLDRAFLKVLEKSTDRAVGICAITQFDTTRTCAEVGMMLQSASLCQGYAKECLGRLANKTFNLFPIHTVWVQYSPGHFAAERLVASLGFTPHDNFEPADRIPEKRVWSLQRPS